MDLSDDQFMAVVIADIRDETDDEVAEALAGDLETVERWCAALGQHVNVLNQQFADRKARHAEARDACWSADRKAEWFEADSEYQSWKRNASKYKGFVQLRLSEAKGLRAELRRQASVARDNVLLRDLLAAVRAHRDELSADPRPSDVVLWGVLP